MSLLSMCQDVADVIGLTRPLAIITGQDQLARQMLGFARETLEELSIMDWPILQIPYSFSTVAGQSQYALPTDFGREVGETVYDAGRYVQVRGALTPGDWARQRNVLPNLGAYRFRIFGNPLQLNLSPTPQEVESIVFEYQTLDRVRSIDLSFKATFSSDDDTTAVPEDIMKKGLKWRMRRAKGLDYSEEFDDYELTRTQRLAQQLSLGAVDVAYRNRYDGIPCPYVPESGFG